MRTRRRVTMTAAVALLVFSVGMAPAEAGPQLPIRPADPVPELGGGSELNDDYAEISREEAELLARVDAAQTAQTELRAELASLEAKVLDSKEALAAAEVAVATAQDTLADAEEDETAAEAAAERADERATVAEEHLRDQIVASFVRGGDVDTEVLSAILHATGPDDVSNAKTYSKVVVGDSDAVVQDLLDARAARRRAHEAAETARATAEKARVSAESQRDTKADAKAFLSTARDDQAGLVADIDEQVEAEFAALAAIEARKSQIEAQMAALAATSQDITDLLGQQTGGGADAAAGVLITNPLPGRPPGSAYGPRKHPILGTTRLHAGVDMGAPTGTVIYAPADGVVLSAGVRGGYGNATIIDHGSSLGTLYGHQSRIDVKAGQVVKRGDPIGLVGTTGLSTGPHLHFETRINGVPVNPVSVVDFSRPVVSYEADAEALADLLEKYQATLDGN